MTIAGTAVGPTSPIVATAPSSPITGTSPVRTDVTGLTNAIIATGLINPITGTNLVPSAATGPIGSTGPNSLRGRRNRSAARPRKSGGALSRRHRAPSRAARLRHRAVSRAPSRAARLHHRAVSRAPSRSVSRRRRSHEPNPN